MATVTGTEGNDILNGTAGDDTITGLGGNDILEGMAGNDLMYGGDGRDTFVYQSDEPVSTGDELYGGAGHDRIQLWGLGASSFFGTVISSIEEIEFTSGGASDFDRSVYIGSASLETGDGFAFDLLIDGNHTADSSNLIEINVSAGVENIDISGWTFQDWTDGPLYESGTDTILVNGNTNDNIITTSQVADTVYSGVGTDIVRANGGDDVVDAGAGVDTVYGGNGRDMLWGGDGDDTVYGGNQGDYIYGGYGLDLLYGGGGNDIFYYWVTNDFSEGEELFGGNGTDTLAIDAAGDFDLRLLDVNSIERIAFTQTADSTTLRLGSVEMDTDWEFAPDLMVNGDVAHTNSDALHIYVTQEVEDIDLSLWTFTDWDIANDAVYLIGSRNANVLTGSAVDEAMYAGAGDDVLRGNGGNDTIHGESGDDLIYGGAGDDTLDLGEGENTAYGGNGGDYVIGGDDSDVIYGGAGNDSLFGEDGADQIYAGSGTDHISSGEGNDLIVFASISFGDIINGGPGIDTLDLSATTQSGIGFDFFSSTILFSISADSAESASVNTLDSIEIFHDGSGANTVFAASYLMTYHLNGGADLFEIGSSSSDMTVYAGAGRDTIVFGEFSIRFLDLSSGTTDDSSINYYGFERVIGTDAEETITGNNAANDIYLGLGDDYGYGGNGADYMRGEGGNDVLNGDNGADNVAGGAGADIIYDSDSANGDTLNGNNGIDLLSYQFAGYANNIMVIDLAAGTAIDNNGTDIILNFENVDGSGAGETIRGSDGVNYINGRGGHDIIEGRGGNDELTGAAGGDTLFGGTDDDFLYGGKGNDTLNGDNGDDELTGGAGADTLDGGAHHDVLFGGSGQDRLEGGRGNDVLIGGGGADRFVYAGLPTEGDDIIIDFTNGTDLIEIGGSVTFSDLTITASGIDTVVGWNSTFIVIENINAGFINANDFDFV